MNSSLLIIVALIGAVYCKEIEMPSYDVLSTDGSFEIRRYPATKWVSTTFKGQANDANTSDMFRRLFNYISGANDAQEKIEMTAPVLRMYQNMNGNELINQNSYVTITERFYIPKVNQQNTPIPTNAQESIVIEPEMIVATYRFGGKANFEDYIYYRDLLISKLGEQAQEYDLVNMITAGYSSPYTLFNRRNEIILKKKL